MGLEVLPARLLLQPFGHGVEGSVGMADFGSEEETVRMFPLTGADVDHALEPVPPRRLEDVPESAHVDGERGFRVFLNGAVAGEEDSGADDIALSEAGGSDAGGGDGNGT